MPEAYDMTKRKLFWIGVVATLLFAIFDARLYVVARDAGFEAFFLILHVFGASLVAIAAWAAHSP